MSGKSKGKGALRPLGAEFDSAKMHASWQQGSGDTWGGAWDQSGGWTDANANNGSWGESQFYGGNGHVQQYQNVILLYQNDSILLMMAYFFRISSSSAAL